MASVMEKVVYLYHHVPKCGGRSFIKQCKEWFPWFQERIGSYPTDERIAEFARTRLDFDELPSPAFVHGHLVSDGLRPFERYGDHVASGCCRVLTIVRDPMERCISAFFHRRKKGREWHGTLETWVLTRRNRLANFLGVTETNWRERLDSYILVGTTEQLQLTTDVFAKMTGNSAGPIPHLNPSARDAYKLPTETVEKFRARNALDLEIHSYAVERLASDAAALGLTQP
jgi:Sulfotransferase domain